MARTSKQILQNDYLIARAKIIEVAAVLDRIDRAVEAEEHEGLPGGPNLGGKDPSEKNADSIQSEVSGSAKALVYEDPSYQKIRNAIAILNDLHSDKTRRIQELLSRSYDPNWKQKFAMPQK